MTKHILLMTFCIATGSAGMHAQSPAMERDPGRQEQRLQERAGERTAQLVRELGLNDEQALKVGVINSEFAKGMADVRSAGMEEAARKERSKALHQQRSADLKAVLTEEQYAHLKELNEARRNEKQEKQGGQRGTRDQQRSGELMQQLGLSDEQAGKVRTINEAFTKGMSELRASGLDGEARKVKVKALRTQRDGELRNVLTEDQYRKLEQLRKERREAKAAPRAREVK
jgi:Spy/CpxP family protein refolding chaperone